MEADERSLTQTEGGRINFGSEKDGCLTSHMIKEFSMAQLLHMSHDKGIRPCGSSWHFGYLDSLNWQRERHLFILSTATSVGILSSTEELSYL